MLQKIQKYCMKCFHCNEISNEDYEEYDYKKNEEITLDNKKQFDKLLNEIVIIHKNNETEVKNLTVPSLSEDEIEYVLC